MTLHPETIGRLLAVVTALVAAVTDYLYGKIFNRHLLWALGAGILLLAVIWGFWVGGLPTGSARYAKQFGGPSVYLLRVLGNSALALAIGFGLWLGGMWAAGDAKLLFILTLLLPLDTYTRNFWPLYPGYPLLFNTFLSMIAILIIELVAGEIKNFVKSDKHLGNPLKNLPNLIRDKGSELWRMTLIFLLFFMMIKTFRELARKGMETYLHLHNNVLVYFFLFLLYAPLRAVLSRKWPRRILVTVTLSAAVYISLFPHGDMNFYTLIGMSGVAIALVLFRWGYEYYMKNFEERQVPLSELKAGAILSRNMLSRVKERDPDFIQTLGTIMPDGLTQGQVDAIKDWYEQWNLQPVVGLRKTLPFAPALLLGTIITIIFGGFPFDLHG